MSDYCLVRANNVESGPRTLPIIWYNSDTGETIANLQSLSAEALLGLGWYPYQEIDNGVPTQPPDQYDRSLSGFTINSTSVERTVIYTEWTQAQYDNNTPITVTDSQRIALDLAEQTERTLQQNTYRSNVGKDTIIPAGDLSAVEGYLGNLYDSIDDPLVAVVEPPAAIRQIIDVPGENVSRATVRRDIVNFGGFDYTRLTYTLYPVDVDPTGMSFKVHLFDGTYLSTYNLIDQGDGSWKAETNLIGALRDVTVDLKYVLFKGIDISQMRDFLHTDEDKIFDVKWS